jgi:hypothetical protein
VYVIDVGISRVYGGYSAALEIMGGVVTAIYPKGRFMMSYIELCLNHLNNINRQPNCLLITSRFDILI